MTLSAFADDHSIRKSFTAKCYTYQENMINNTENTLTTIADWMTSMCLKLNSDKTEFIMFGSRQMLKHANTSHLNLALMITAAQQQGFLNHINSIDKNIQFTSEEPRTDGSIPFLDVWLTPGVDGSITTSVFRKPTHTELYMQWDNHHAISSKYSVIGTLHYRANTICSSPELLQQEEQHLKKVLTKCKYPVWALNRVKIRMKRPAHKNQQKTRAA